MDEMKITLSTKFMRNLISKIIAKELRKKLDAEVDVQLHTLSVQVIEGRVHVHVDVDGNIESDDFKKILKKVQLLD